MKKTFEFEGKTVEQAIEKALLELGLEEDDIEIKVLEEANKGIFGIGSKLAKIEVSFDEDDEEDEEETEEEQEQKELEEDCEENEEESAAISEIREFLNGLFNKLDVEVEISIEEQEKVIKVDISGERVEIIIGRRGETLDSIQYLTNLIVNKRGKYYKHIIIDVENYRKRREETLQGLARRLAKKVKMYKEDVALEPMNSYERMIIHSTLQQDPEVETYSEGEDPYRKVIISLKK